MAQPDMSDADGSMAFVAIDDDDVSPELVEYWANQGDQDALVIQGFEKDLEDLLQGVPDFHNAYVSYQEARYKLTEKKKHRGFWPNKEKGKSSWKGGKKGGSKGKDELLSRIARTHCKLCGEKGHWKAECPNRDRASSENVNMVMDEVFYLEDATFSMDDAVMPAKDKNDQVIFETSSMTEAWQTEEGEIFETCNFVLGDVGGKAFFQRTLQLKESKRQFRSTSKNDRKPVRSKQVPSQPLPTLKTEPLDQVNLSGANKRADEKSRCFAILDTGASRSVMGQHLLPALLKSLPPSVSSQIRRKPSKIGFRFGNNHVAYSHEQIHVPLKSGKKKIWLVIEVVSQRTPFLMSIHAMKCLGAQTWT